MALDVGHIRSREGRKGLDDGRGMPAEAHRQAGGTWCGQIASTLWVVGACLG